MSGAARCLLVALALLPGVAATHQGPADLNAVDLNVLVYHPFPDENGDPWGVPAREVNGTAVDWMQGTYGAFFYPTAVFDGLIRIDEMTQGEGGGEFQETYATYESALQSRRMRDAPVSIRIEGQLEEPYAVVNVSFVPDSPFASQSLLVRIVLFEDDVVFNGGSGILHHRFVVREERQHELQALGAEGASYSETFRLAPVVRVENVGVVAVLQNFEESSPLFAYKEVLQSATWLARQQGPTVQSARGVLLELYSATWCTACVVGDAVADDLANAYGIQSGRVVDSRFEYLRPGDWWKVVVAFLGAGIAGFWMRRGRRPEASS